MTVPVTASVVIELALKTEFWLPYTLAIVLITPASPFNAPGVKILFNNQI